MIVVELEGGLASQLHKYAVARTLADITHQRLKLDIRSYSRNPAGKSGRIFGLDKFNVRAGIANSYEIVKSRGYIEPLAMYLGKLGLGLSQEPDIHAFRNQVRRLFGRRYFRADITKGPTQAVFEAIRLAESTDLYVSGEWGMGTNFFDENRQRIVSDFTPKCPLSICAQRFFAQIESQEIIACHIRRGDYVGHNILRLCEEGYYLNAANCVLQSRPDARLAIFTDDPVWVNEYFLPILKQEAIIVEGCEAWEDFYLLSRCRHFVLSASGFSSLASWLSASPEKIVVSPRQWFYDQDVNSAQLSQLPADWIYL